jgi:RecJ-like exonuclease
LNEHLRRAIDALETGVTDLRALSGRSAPDVRRRLRRTVEEVLEHLEADEDGSAPEDIMSRLERQSRDIAEDLRRAERLMKKKPREQ